MTPEERRNPEDTIDESRRRVAKGAGTSPSEVVALIEQFKPMAELMKRMSGMAMRDRMRLMRDFGQRATKGMGKRLTPEERARLKKREEVDNL